MTTERDPVASVVVDVGLAHLDRPFEYTIAPAMDVAAQPGVRVRVSFAGRVVTGFIVGRAATADHPGRLAPLRAVVSDEPVLTPALLTIARRIADRYAGTLPDVLRLAVPKRHAGAEKALPRDAGPPAEASVTVPDAGPAAVPDAGPWAAYPAGPAFLRRLREGEAPAASWLALPQAGGPGDWPDAFAVAAEAALAGGRGFLLVVPDHRDVDRLEQALVARLGARRFVRLTADQGPQARYTAWLKVLRGYVDGAIGTRSAAFAPVRRLGLVAWWDDGDDLYDEPRAPYPHVREVLAAQADVAGAALLSGGYVRTVTIADWVAQGRMRELVADRRQVRAAAPTVALAGEGRAGEADGAAARAHLPPAAWRAARAALEDGPVLVQVPRRGYLPALTCQDCRTPARCAHCGGPLALGSAGGRPACRWCARPAAPGGCPACGSTQWRSAVVGHRRTAEELGRAFPGVPVVTSGTGKGSGPGSGPDEGAGTGTGAGSAAGAGGRAAGQVLATVDDRPRLVIATPGAEPVAAGGYAAALLLDAWAFLDRPSVDAGQEALRRWAAAAALVRSAQGSPPRQARVVICGAPEHVAVPAVEALVRWAPDWLAERELAERRELGLPPAAWMAQLTGPRAELEQLRRTLTWPAGALLGDLAPAQSPGPGADRADGAYRMLVRVPPGQAAALNELLAGVRARGSARRDPATPGVRVGISDVVG